MTSVSLRPTASTKPATAAAIPMYARALCFSRSSSGAEQQHDHRREIIRQRGHRDAHQLIRLEQQRPVDTQAHACGNEL